jgi:hypothetical protein
VDNLLGKTGKHRSYGSRRLTVGPVSRFQQWTLQEPSRLSPQFDHAVKQGSIEKGEPYAR